MNESIMIDDLVILGRACPERLKDGRTTVCTAGYSPKYGFIRIYPTEINMKFGQWDIVKVPLERNPRDTRNESWKIKGSKHEWDKLHEKIEIVRSLKKKDRLNLISNLADDCVNIINGQKRSLGIIKPNIQKCYFLEHENYDRSTPVTLSGRALPKVKDQYPKEPRIQYRCSNCQSKRFHNQIVLEWGFYEWMRKNPDNCDQVWENAQIYSDAHNIFFLVGNLARYRRSFIIISILRLPKAPISKPLIPLQFSMLILIQIKLNI